MSLVKTDEKVSDVVAGEDDDEMTQLVRSKSTSVAREASKLPNQAAADSDKAKLSTQEDENIAHPLEDENKYPSETTPATKETNDRVRKTNARPTRISQQEPFNKGLRPTKSVLKRSNHPIRTSTTYESNTPASPTPSSPPAVSSSTEKASEGSAAPARAARSPIQEERKCCVVM